MTDHRPHDLVASVRDRLLRLSRQRGEDFQVTLIRFAVERLLYRLSRSPYREQFVLKGAMLFSVWEALPHRSTRDLDLLGRGNSDAAALARTFKEIVAADVEPDGIEFVSDSLQTEALQEGQAYEGTQISLEARLGRTRIPVQVDIAFGQAVSPEASEADFPSLLGQPSARLLTYPPEVVVAEKFQAMVSLGVTNSRMKDFFDVAYLATELEFDAQRLAQALQATFARRQTPLPAETPLALTSTYFESPERKRDWNAFRRRGGLGEDSGTLQAACFRIERLLMPVCGWLRQGTVPSVRWRDADGWG